MPRNVEIKARVEDLEGLEQRVRTLATSGPQSFSQHDQFFCSSRGRLKLRRFGDGHAELIFYRRPDQTGPATSNFRRVAVRHPDELAGLLAASAGAAGEVFKARTLYRIGTTRVHLDRVQGLGGFVELEVSLRDGATEEQGVAVARSLMAELGIDPGQLVDAAYVDLLARPKKTSAASEF